MPIITVRVERVDRVLEICSRVWHNNGIIRVEQDQEFQPQSIIIFGQIYAAATTRLKVGLDAATTRLKVGLDAATTRLKVGLDAATTRLKVGLDAATTRLKVGLEIVQKDRKQRRRDFLLVLPRFLMKKVLTVLHYLIHEILWI